MPIADFARAAYERPAFGLPTVECVNFYPEMSPSHSKEPITLIPTPGSTAFASVGSGGIHGLFQKDGILSGACIAVTANTVYTVSSGGSASSIGTVAAFDGGARFAGDDDELVIVTDNIAYLCTGGAVTELLTDVVDVEYLNSRFLFITAAGTMKYSAVTDATSVAALDFITAESAPDGLRGIRVMNGEIYLAGPETIEIWTNTSSSADPFQRRPGGVLPFGLASRDSFILGPDKSLWLIGNDRKVYRITASGVSPVENPTIGGMLEQLSEDDLRAVTAWGYAASGHRFVGFDLPGIATMVYDIDAGAWAKRRTFGETLWTGYAVERIFGKVMVGARDGSTLHELSDSVFTENGAVIERMATAHVKIPERTAIDNLTLYARRGVGNSAVTSPQVMLSMSKDGGRSFGNEIMRGLGAVGEYATRIIWRRLGRAKQYGVIFKLRVTDACSAVFTGAEYE